MLCQRQEIGELNYYIVHNVESNSHFFNYNHING